MSALITTYRWIKDVHEREGIVNSAIKILNTESRLTQLAFASRFFAELIVAGLVEVFVRPTCSTIRLGLALSGRINRWEALTNTSGVGAARVTPAMR